LTGSGWRSIKCRWNFWRGGVAQPLYLRSGLYFPQDYRTARRAADVAVRGADYFDPRFGGGDVAFYDDVPLLPVLVVFVTLALLYRGIMWLMGHSEKLEDLLEGKPIVVVEEGQLAWEKLHAENMTEFEFLWSCGSTASSSLARCGWRSLKPTGRSACFIIPMKR
jgi:hypothetical protein